MSHRVAELIKRADTATDTAVKEAAEKECQDLIIRLWETRENWPSGGPLHSLMPTLKILLNAEHSYRRFMWQGEQENSSGLITRLLKLHQEELQQVYHLIKDQVPVDILNSMQELLTNHQDDLTDVESDLISLILNPSNITYFSNEEMSNPNDDESEKEESEDLTDPTTISESDKISKLQKSIELKRIEYFEAVARALGKGKE